MLNANKINLLFIDLNQHWKKLAIVVLCIILGVLLNLYLPLLYRSAADFVFVSKNLKMLIRITTYIMLIMLIDKILTCLRLYYLNYVAEHWVMDLRNRLYSHLHNQSIDFFTKQQIGNIVSIIINDVWNIQNLVAIDLPNIIISPLLLTGGIILAFLLSWKLALIAFIVFPLVGFVSYFTGNKIRQLTRFYQRKLANLSSIIQEVFSGIIVVKSFVRTRYEIGKFSRENFRFFNYALQRIKIKSVFIPLNNLLLEMGIAGVLLLGAITLVRNNITPGLLVAFMVYFTMIADNLNKIANFYVNWQQYLASEERILEILKTESQICELPNSTEIAFLKGNIIFDNVSFSYNDEARVLDNVNFKINIGEIIALVGTSAEGKTTIANLIPRFYDPIEGHVLINGMDIKKVKLESLRRQIGIVHQETFLFNTSIKENIAYGKQGANEDEVVEAAKIANAHEFILQLHDGYETKVGERGVRLSGGQKQRIAIARAIIGKPRMLILDEATSSLDAETEAMVQERLYQFIKENNVTTIVIAHRLSTILFADRILVVKDGGIVEEGTHENLLKNAETYQRLYKRQMEIFT